MKIRTGFGYDVHRLVAGRELWLCGVRIDHELGLLGHSDADVAIHAICDALLGAAALGDIGKHFPDNDPKFSGIDSKILLDGVNRLLLGKGYNISNIDCTISAEKPRISAYIEEMRETLAKVLNIEADCVSVKATTTEKLGFTGREEGIAAYAVVLIHSTNH
ncbi:MAG: 2-C-methyl-D-erythritol 2,4-cyclodiphosphate synthase [Bacteroidetes bacterium]|nr:2-C-methyl-D-erythritol 2,4-cyclodiphosphate synthase [Bacteroidota bacterium]MBU1720564.1 2-C-methyl-D-erythritol 2,4-cyclodiphosphate synthase [Bacteroidota bacterium]